MRLLIQRVTRAEVRVRGERVGQIGRGLVVLVGVGHGDGPEVAEQMAGKCVDLRIFRDPEGKTNLALAEVAGEVLAVSQFTLFADTSRGRRPSFLDAAPPPSRRVACAWRAASSGRRWRWSWSTTGR